MIGDTVEPAVNTQCETESSAADGLDDLRKLIRLVTRHVENRAKLLSLELVERSQLKQVRWKEMSGAVRLRKWAGIEQAGICLHACRVFAQALQGRIGNDW